ncbi:hypothetical protein LTR84_007612 [Exophiala bonariae]|uniref:FAD-binding domain-containing protein n=1 Tax=Exophiala bonariae TaxID=1690606 RepID=A0AAV9NKJ6_9EURO|nr:hypothetical protein LTR84_007612 [Exophiala bonariae]
MISKVTAPEIAIVGGGPSGLALAGMLERAGFDYVVYERESKESLPRGGCLDLHLGSGQRAMKEAGCFDKMNKYGRRGDATIHTVFDPAGTKVATWGEGHDKPELDRGQIKAALLTTIPDSKIKWGSRVKEVVRDEQGNIVLQFEGGEKATGFKLVVGADGAFSKVRHLVTTATPQYAKRTFINGTIHPDNPFYPTVLKSAGVGPQVVMGKKLKIWNQMQGDGHYRVDLGFERPVDFTRTGTFDLSDTEAVKKLLLTEEFFGQYSQYFQDLISACEGPLFAWPLWHMPTDRFNWAPNADVTVIGDAAHVTPPFVGDGVNCAMRDSIILSQKLKEFGITKDAVAAYEKEMFGWATDLIERSLECGDLFFDWNAPGVFFETLAKKPLIGTTDNV